jgi:dTDP-4-amino-4,6-dideoxygalactose transaminase
MIPEIKPYLHFKEFKTQFQKINNPIEQFEASFSEFSGFPYALYFSWARSGLAHLLSAMGLKNQKIITPAYTCEVVPQGIAWSGNRPYFIDNTANNINMDNDLLLKHSGSDTPVAILTSLFGRKHNPDIIVQKLKDKGILVIKDVSLAFGVKHNGIPVSNYADVAMYSTNAGKPVSSYGGGFLTFKDMALYEKVKAHRNNNAFPPKFKSIFLRQLSFNLQYIAFQKWIYGMVVYLKDNTKIIDIFVKQNEEDLSIPKQHYEIPAKFQAKIGLVQLKRFEKMDYNRKALANFYEKEINKSEIINTVPFNEDDSLSHFHIRVKKGKREIFKKHLLKNSIYFGIHFDYSNPDLLMFKDYKSPDAPNSRVWAEEMVTIPFYPGLSKSNAHRVVEVINKFKIIE